MKIAALLISYIFHPIFFPLYLLVFTLFIPVYSMQKYQADFKIYLLAFVFISNILIPILSLWLLKKNKIIADFEISQPQQRNIPYLLMFILYTFTAISLGNIYGLHPIIILTFVLAASVVLGVTIVNFFIKVSAHSATAAAAAGWLYVIFVLMEFNTVIYFIFLVIVLGLVMSSRLFLKAHKPFEVWLGAILGTFISLLFLLLPHIL